MRILIIKGKNLASLEQEFEINFREEPLKSAGIFAITGPTGGGKSTILDALCLALYDKAPRYDKAEQLKPESEDSDKISLQDARNILRKGTAEGYAIVEFMGLNDQQYRSEWHVKRARGKSQGAIQDVKLKLFNLTQNTEVLGTKTAIKEKIVSLIGLTFDQFTRAVMLAQGDFASFLTAKTSEKAELLEKLTGTEIYSRISSEIFKKKNIAEAEFREIENQIKNLALLSDEELANVTQECKNLKDNLETISKKIQITNDWIKWLTDSDILKKNISDVRQELEGLALIEKQNIDRQNYLILAEKVKNEIRDKYFEFGTLKNQHESNITSLKEKEKEKGLLTERLTDNKKEIEALKSKLEDIKKKNEDAIPLIDKAKALDIQLEMLTNNIKEKEATSKKLFKDIENIKIAEMEGEIAKIDRNLKSTEDWLAKYNFFEPILGNVPMINKTIEAYYEDTDMLRENNKFLNESKTFLETLKNTLNLTLEEQQLLENQLPSEVWILRTKLHVGCPCPVCGSTNHPYLSDHEGKSERNEAELEKAKNGLKEKITSLNEKIDKAKNLITRYDIDIEILNKRISLNYLSLENYLRQYPNWKDELENSSLAAKLKDLTIKWNKCQNVIVQFKQERAVLNSNLDSNMKIKNKLESERKSLFDELEDKKEELSNFQAKRQEIFKGKTIKEVESYFKNTIARQVADIENSENKFKEISNKQAELIGTIKQIEKQIEKQEIDKLALLQIIENWKNKNPNIDEHLLDELALKDDKWLKIENQFFKDLGNNKISLNATLKERLNNLDKHNALETRPISESETIESLNERLNLLKREEEVLKPLFSDCEIKIAMHEQNTSQSNKLKSELERKENIFENWARLNELLGSADGAKFKKIAQGYTLDVLLEFANYHLSHINKRYQLEKIPSTLALRVIDKDMFDEVRPVNCLSGGESFLVSLALALGLSSLSSNKLQIESLFIDEGFGSLDSDTLSMAMEALENLQTLGRRIGVISHVEEMKERIPVQVTVNKTKNGGSSTIKVIGY